MPALQAQQINRCTGADGNAVYSDRRCQDLEAVARPATPARAPGSQGLYRDSCLRRLSELVDHLQSAIAAGDANQLASVYQWSGVSNAGATHILERLETIARRPLLDISPVYAAASAPPISTAAGAARFTVASGSDGLHTGTTTGVPADARRRPHALRLQQGDAAPQTELQLHRQYGCFWITL